MPTININHGDCLDWLKTIDTNSIDVIITDPPYGLSGTTPTQIGTVIGRWASGDTHAMPEGKGFANQEWDRFVPPPAVWEQCLRILKPGAHLAAFSATRTQDLMGISIRIAGFEIRDCLAWIYSSGFPGALDIAKSIDKQSGIWRGRAGHAKGRMVNGNEWYERTEKGNAITKEAKRWEGWHTKLKPSIEPIILARKPLLGTLTNNILTHGAGGLNIDATRIQTHNPATNIPQSGRWPTNVLFDQHAAKELDEQQGDREYFHVFKYESKAPSWERPTIYDTKGEKTYHPTVKPLALMEWLIHLLTPPRGTIVDPFAGSGTTLQAAKKLGFNAYGCEQSADYIKLINQRINPNIEELLQQRSPTTEKDQQTLF